MPVAPSSGRTLDSREEREFDHRPVQEAVVLQATVERGTDAVVCRGHRHWLRAAVGDDGLRVESASLATPRWRRVDDDVVQLTRAVTRLVAVDRRAADAVNRHAAALAGIPPRDPNPITGLTRAVFPLLAAPEPWPLVAPPSSLPPTLQPVFRARSPRAACRLLFGDRTTRPVVRALSELLADGGAPDLFVVTTAMAAAPLLEPDHLTAVLAAPRGAGADPTPLTGSEMASLRRLLRPVAPRRVVRALGEATGDAATRRRLRFVVSAGPTQLDLDVSAGWDRLALAVATAPPAGGP